MAARLQASGGPSRRKDRAGQNGSRFDARYYARYYGSRRTRVSSRADVKKLARFVCGYLAYLGQPVRHVLDAGCGVGHWRHALAEHLPRARYVGIELSEHICKTHGFTQASVVDYASSRPFDLVICQGVLQYLDDKSAAAAIKNLGKLCHGALYLEALTQEDWDEVCDRRYTDGRVHLRPASFYRKRLARDFRSAGGGLYLHRESEALLYALEEGA